jgi:hypothetical protein
MNSFFSVFALSMRVDAPFSRSENQPNVCKPELETQELEDHGLHWPARATGEEYLLKDLCTSYFQKFDCVCMCVCLGGEGVRRHVCDYYISCLDIPPDLSDRAA